MKELTSQPGTDQPATGAPGPESPRQRRVGPIERAAAVLAAALSVGVVIAILLAAPRSGAPVTSAPPPAPTASERGNPALAATLADQARLAADPTVALQFWLAAHVVAPDRAVYRHAVAHPVLATLAPSPIVAATLAGYGPVEHAALSANGAFLITGGAAGWRLWQTRWSGTPPRVRAAGAVTGPVIMAAAAGDLSRTTVITASETDVSVWAAVAEASARRLTTRPMRANAVAVADSQPTAVTIDGRTATVWDISGTQPAPSATVSFEEPVTTLAFAPGDGLILGAGTATGGVVIQSLDLRRSSIVRRILTGGGGPVDAVALSQDGTTVLATTTAGTLAVWDLHNPTPAPAATVTGALAPGSHRVWINVTGDHAFTADASTAPTVWSFADRTHPTRLASLPVSPTHTVPAMVTSDGGSLATIDRDVTLTIWDVKSLNATLADPIPRACALAHLTEERWQQMVPDPTFANPCQAPPLPSLGVEDDPSASPTAR